MDLDDLPAADTLLNLGNRDLSCHQEPHHMLGDMVPAAPRLILYPFYVHLILDVTCASFDHEIWLDMKEKVKLPAQHAPVKSVRADPAWRGDLLPHPFQFPVSFNLLYSLIMLICFFHSLLERRVFKSKNPFTLFSRVE